MSDEADDKERKLRLRSGQLRTAFKHYTVIAKGVAGALMPGYSCRPGNAFMGMKTWARSAEESVDMVRSVGAEIGFRVTGRIELYETEPKQPPLDHPIGYDIQFTPFD